MKLCVKPGCENPENHDKAKICSCCGAKLLLKERYRAIKPLGKGGFGKTFLAVDEDIPSQPYCVIKQFYFFSEDKEYLNKAVTLFGQEAVHLEGLGQHFQIPSLLAYFEQEDILYLVQEFVEGENLKQELKLGVFDEEKICELLIKLLPVLQYIHDRKVIHRDIKPENIMRRNSDRQLLLIDFGIAKLLSDSAIHRTGTIVGSQNYAPPEQFRGKVFPASDLYSLGVTCIHLLTGVSPRDMYDCNNEVWCWRQYLSPENKTSDRLGNILDKLLASKINQRYQSAAEVLQDINLPISDDAETEALPPQKQSNTSEFPETGVTSEIEMKYSNLAYLLIAQKWKEADRETWKMMCLALEKLPETHIEVSEIDRLPCEDLIKLDRLWVKYSEGRFGFSVQKQIYQSLKGDYVSFCDRINWLTYNSPSYHQKLKFSLLAPPGHLPSRIWVTGTAWMRHADAMSWRLEKCHI